jgi:hypothetical protein
MESNHKHDQATTQGFLWLHISDETEVILTFHIYFSRRRAITTCILHFLGLSLADRVVPMLDTRYQGLGLWFMSGVEYPGKAIRCALPHWEVLEYNVEMVKSKASPVVLQSNSISSADEH